MVAWIPLQPPVAATASRSSNSLPWRLGSVSSPGDVFIYLQPIDLHANRLRTHLTAGGRHKSSPKLSPPQLFLALAVPGPLSGLASRPEGLFNSRVSAQRFSEPALSWLPLVGRFTGN